MENDEISLILNINVYPLDVIYSTSYLFLDRAYIILDKESDEKIKVQIKIFKNDLDVAL